LSEPAAPGRRRWCRGAFRARPAAGPWPRRGETRPSAPTTYLQVVQLDGEKRIAPSGPFLIRPHPPQFLSLAPFCGSGCVKLP
jgi:hypothetical protein